METLTTVCRIRILIIQGSNLERVHRKKFLGRTIQPQEINDLTIPFSPCRCSTLEIHTSALACYLTPVSTYQDP
jgi:hypothetical protein